MRDVLICLEIPVTDKEASGRHNFTRKWDKDRAMFKLGIKPVSKSGKRMLPTFGYSPFHLVVGGAFPK